jgi:membrane fusion protein, multidrug efflux system
LRVRGAQKLRQDHGVAPVGFDALTWLGLAENTDTVTLRGVVPNPVLPGMLAGQPGARELTDGEFATVIVEGVQPIAVLASLRATALSDQQGEYVYVVDAQNKAQIRRIQLGQSTPSTAVVTNGL